MEVEDVRVIVLEHLGQRRMALEGFFISFHAWNAGSNLSIRLEELVEGIEVCLCKLWRAGNTISTRTMLRKVSNMEGVVTPRRNLMGPCRHKVSGTNVYRGRGTHV